MTDRRHDSPASTPAGRVPETSGHLGSFLLPLVLSLLPVIAGFWEARRLEEYSQNRRTKSLQSATDVVAARMRRVTAPSFWPGELSRRLRKRIVTRTRSLISPPAPEGELSVRPSGPRFGKLLSRALKRHGLQGMPRVKVWAVEITPGPPLAVKWCDEAGFERSGIALHRRLLEEICKETLSGKSDLPQWENRLRAMFGPAAGPEFFRKNSRCHPFPVEISGRFGFLIWDLLVSERKPLGAYMLFFPSGGEEIDHGMHFSIRNWKIRDFAPAFIGFPSGLSGSDSRILKHPALRSSAFNGILEDLQRRMVPVLSKNPSDDVLGNVWLPVGMEGKILYRGNVWFRVLSIAPETGSVGLLMGEFPPRGLLTPSRAVSLAGAFVLLAWGMLLVFRFRSGFWPDLTIVQSFLLWFLGLASVALVLGAMAGASFLANHEENLKDGLVREMRAALVGLESEASRLDTIQETEFRNLFKDDSIARKLRRLQKAGDIPGIADFKARLWEYCRDRNLQLSALQIIGHRGFYSYVETLGLPKAVTRSWLEVLRATWESKLGSETEQIAAELDHQSVPLAASATFLSEPGMFPGSTQGTSLAKAPLSAGAFATMEIVGRDTIAPKFFTPVKTLGGRKFAVNLLAPALLDRSLWFVLGFVWDQDLAFKTYFRDTVPKNLAFATGEDAPFRLGVFFRGDRGIEPVFPETPSPRLKTLVERTCEWKTTMESTIDGVPSIICILPSKNARGFILTAFTSLEPLQALIRRDAVVMASLFLLSLALLALSAAGLSGWLGTPLVRISRGLERISRGDLEIAVAEKRDDELGEAGRVLDGMTRNLRERRTMTRFVAPQVLEIVAGGDIERALEGTNRLVAVLASDIRDFTSISETFPPREVFAALNSHIQAMTAVIQREGGVVDRFIGDAIVAVFYPSEKAAPEARAFRTARGMMAAHSSLMLDRKAQGSFGYSIGVGIDSGQVLAGAVGDEDVRLDFSILGDPPNRAAVLEGLSKKGRASRIVVSTRVRDLLPAPATFLPIPGDTGAWEAPEAPEDPISGPSKPALHELPEPVSPSMDHSELPSSCDRRTPNGPLPDPEPTRTTREVGVCGHGWRIANEPSNGNRMADQKTGGPASIPTSGNPHHWMVPTYWFGVLLLIAISTGLLVTTSQEAAEEKIRSRFLELEGIVTAGLDPETFLSNEAAKRAYGAQGMWPEDPVASECCSAIVARRMETIERLLPGFKWAVVEFPRIHSSATAVIQSISVKEPPFRNGDFPGSGQEEIVSLQSLSGWVATNVGFLNPPIPVKLGDGRLTLFGGGLDLAMATDSFLFLFRPGAGSFRLDSTVSSFTGTHPSARAGLMARLDTNQGSPFVGIFVSPDATIELLVRGTPDTVARVPFKSGPVRFPVRLRLEGDKEGWKCSFAGEGGDWTRLPPVQATLGSKPQIGLGVCGGLWNDEISTDGTEVLAKSGFPPEWDQKLVSLCVLGRQMLFPDLTPGMKPTPAFSKWMREEMPGLLGESTSPAFFFHKITRNAGWIPFAGKPEIGFFKIFGLRSVLGTSMGPSGNPPFNRRQIPAENPHVEKRFKFFNETLGAFFFSFDPSVSWIEPSTRLLTATLASEGFQFALVLDGNLVKVASTSPDFLSDGRLAGLIDRHSPGVRRMGDREVFVSSTLTLLGHRAEFILGKTLPTLEVLGGITPVPWIVLSGWLLLGLGWLFRKKLRVAGRGMQLRGKLTLAFLATLLPSFTLAFLVVERSGVEATTRIRGEARDTLVQSLEQYDRGQEMCSSWARSLIRDCVDKSPLTRDYLVSPEKGMEPAQIRDACDAILRKLIERGLVAIRGVFTAPQGDTIVTSCDPYSVQEREDQLWNLFADVIRAIEGKDSPSFSRELSNREKQSFIIQSEAENVRNSFRLVLGAEALGEVFSRPEAMQSMLAGKGCLNTLYSRKLRTPSGSSAEIRIDIGSGRLERALLPGLNHFPKYLPHREMRMRYFHIDPIVSEVNPPFFRFISSGTSLFDAGPVRFEGDPEFLGPAAWAAKSREPIFRIFGTGEHEALSLFYPLENFNFWVLNGQVPIGRTLQGAAEGVRRFGLMLLGILVMTVFLARGVAGQFLVPVKELTRACGSIARGDYSPRLPGGWNGEFRILSEAFNRMALEAQEGRLIGRFVSDSVREIARKRSLDPAILEGKACKAIVIFAQLSGFKDLLRDARPESVVQALNSYLRVMSRVIRNHGGEIDKFIGDKILAVVYADPDGSLERAARAGLEIARQMRREMVALGKSLPVDLGVGIVAGPLLAGLLGTPDLRLEYTVIGDTVNLASRLSDLAAGMARGAALVDSGFAEVLGAKDPPLARSTLEALPSVRVKGKAREIGIFRIVE